MDDGLSGPSPEPASNRRRKLRKGTHSCWECKRRKGRCVFASPTDSTCINCRRRGLTCVSQDLPEVSPTSLDGQRNFGDQIGKVQSLLHDLASKLNGDGSNPVAPPEETTPLSNAVYPTPQSAILDPAPSSLIGPPPPQRDHEAISKSLLAAFPSQEDTEKLLRSVHRVTFYCHKLNAEHQHTLKKGDLDSTSSRAWSMPSSKTHPVILAKEMLFWTLFLQCPWYHRDLTFSEAPRLIMERLSNAVISLVTTNDSLHGSLDSLECIMLEGLFHSHYGNLRRAWLVYRKAMLSAQLMGLHRSPRRPFKKLDSKVVFDPEAMWCRIMFMDRYLSLLLGLPHGTNGEAIRAIDLTLNTHSPVQSLEWLLTAISGKILDRNELGRYVYADDQVVDAELLTASKGLSEEFWRPPKFTGMVQGSFEDISDMARLSVQVFYFHLLNQLHLPYMLSSIRSDNFAGEDRRQDYSTMTCVNSSREILRRFNAYRTFNHVALCFRLVDFTALTAALTLLLVHMDSHLSGNSGDPKAMAKKLLSHQRLSDRTLLDQVLETLDLVSQYNVDAMSIESAKMLRVLLRVEEEAAQGKCYHWKSTKAEDEDGNFLGQRVSNIGEAALQISIPCFGAIHISPSGSISTVRPDEAVGSRSTEYGYSHGALTTFSTESPSAGLISESLDSAVINTPYVDVSNDHNRPQAAAYSRPLDDVSADMNLGTAATLDDWALQGVDMAFFDNFMIDTSLPSIQDPLHNSLDQSEGAEEMNLDSVE